jgi:hypothetical protein
MNEPVAHYNEPSNVLNDGEYLDCWNDYQLFKTMFALFKSLDLRRMVWLELSWFRIGASDRYL